MVSLHFYILYFAVHKQINQADRFANAFCILEHLQFARYSLSIWKQIRKVKQRHE